MFDLKPTVIGMAILLAAASAAQAQTTPVTQPSPTAPDPLPAETEAFTLTPFLGLSFAGDLENTPATFGAALGYGLSRRLSVEGDLSFAPGGEQGVLEFDTSTWSLSANVLYHFNGSAENFTPYAAAGLGLLSGNAELEDQTTFVGDDTSTVIGFNLGGGVKAAMNDRWGLRLDLRFFNGDDFAPDHWRLYGGLVLRNIGRAFE